MTGKCFCLTGSSVRLLEAMECKQHSESANLDALADHPNALHEAMRFFNDDTMLWNHPEEDAIENLRNVIGYYAATNPDVEWLGCLDQILLRLQFLIYGSGHPSCEADNLLGPGAPMPDLEKPYHPKPALMKEEIESAAVFMRKCRCFQGKPEWEWFLTHLSNF